MKRCKICGEVVSHGNLHKGCESLLKTASGEQVDEKTKKRATQTLISKPGLVILPFGFMRKII
jgi:hypothetical protein